MRFVVVLIFVFFINAPGQTALIIHSNDNFYDDGFINTQLEAASLNYDYSGTKRLDPFDDKWTELATIGYQAKYARAEIFAIDSGGSGGLGTRPIARHNYYDKVVSWIKHTYRAQGSNDHYASIRLLLLVFGLIGLIGIRRKFKKSWSAQRSGKKQDWILGKTKKDWILRKI
jgi:hypothetical protein